jgi:hypothetical protein
MVSGKHKREGKSQPSQKHTAIDLEMKIRIICKYEGGQSLSALNTIVKDAAHIRQLVNFIFHLIHIFCTAQYYWYTFG